MPAEHERIVERMMAHDRFSQWLGVNVDDIDVGRCSVSMTLRDEMTNGFGRGHGAIVYALADTAMAFAANSRGRVAVALTNTITYPSSIGIGERMVAVATELAKTRRTGTYDVAVTVSDRPVAFFRGTVFRTDASHELDEVE